MDQTSNPVSKREPKANITTVTARAKLTARREPYWARVSKGRYVGFRSSEKSEGSWIARLANEETGKQRYESLGALAGSTGAKRFDDAVEAARRWFELVEGGGGTKEVTTVRHACEAYVQFLRDDALKGDEQANDAAGRFRRYVYSDPKLADCALSSLKEVRLTAWRNELVKTEARVDRTKGNQTPTTAPRALSTVNRDMTALRAALNHARKKKHVASDSAWKQALKPFVNVDGRRSIYLDKDQRAELISKTTTSALSNFVHGLSILPLRVGAVAALRVGAFQANTGELFIGNDKAGARRSVMLGASATAVLKSLCADRKANEWMFLDPRGGKWTRKEWGSQLKAVVRTTNLPDDTVAYTLRHCAITDLVNHGLSAVAIARITGTSVEMIQKQYFHLLERHSRDALEVLAIPGIAAEATGTLEPAT